MYRNTEFKKFNLRQLQKRVAKHCPDLSEYEQDRFVMFLHALVQGRSVFLVNHNENYSEWSMYYTNKEGKQCLFWIPSFMSKSRYKYGRKYAFRSTVYGMDRILAATDYLSLKIELVTGTYTQFTRQDLLS